jgi:Holliday junction DNA helicase RuvA
MIGRLTGQVVEQEADGTVVLDVGGVGYEVRLPLGALGRAEPATGSEELAKVVLHVHTHVREDALILFGFATQADRWVFRRLLSISSVGPKIALAILSMYTAKQLAIFVERDDTAALVAVPGIGKKSAQRIILELRNKLGPILQGAEEDKTSTQTPSDKTAQVIEGLVGMGFKQATVEKAVERLDEQAWSHPIGEVFREVLALLGR